MTGGRTILAVALGAFTLCLVGCLSVGRATPPAPEKFGEVESEERGEVVTVNDTMIDLRTGKRPAGSVYTPGIPIGPTASVSLPVTIGGESRRDIPGEEITVRLAGNKLVVVIQPLSQPPFAPGERVLVQREKPNIITGELRIRVIRDE